MLIFGYVVPVSWGRQSTSLDCWGLPNVHNVSAAQQQIEQLTIHEVKIAENLPKSAKNKRLNFLKINTGTKSRPKT